MERRVFACGSKLPVGNGGFLQLSYGDPEMAKQLSFSEFVFYTGRFILLAVGALSVGAAIGLAIIFLRQDQHLYALAALGVGLICGAALFSLAGVVSLLRRLVYHNEEELGQWHIVQDNMRQQESAMQQISENILISDAAKQVVYRNRDRQLMENAIQEDIENQDWEAAYHLLEQMQSRFGYSREAAQFRRLVDARRSQAVKAVIEESREQIESLCENFNWSEANAMVDSLARQFPGNTEASQIAEWVEAKRLEHKKQLLSSWNQAVQNDEVDRGIDLLRQLDQHLTASEAAALEESARGVFKAKLQNFGVNFSVAVTEKNWSGALEIGRQIMEEFPNSRMAEEVKGKYEILQQRAQQQASA